MHFFQIIKPDESYLLLLIIFESNQNSHLVSCVFSSQLILILCCDSTKNRDFQRFKFQTIENHLFNIKMEFFIRSRRDSTILKLCDWHSPTEH